jgi:hypothetical protein
MTHKQIWQNLGGLGVLIALLELAYWLSTGSRAVPGLVMLAEHGFTCYGTRQVLTQ